MTACLKYLFTIEKEHGRHVDKWIDKYTDLQYDKTGRHTDMSTGRHSDIPTNKHPYRHTYR